MQNQLFFIFLQLNYTKYPAEVGLEKLYSVSHSVRGKTEPPKHLVITTAKLYRIK